VALKAALVAALAGGLLAAAAPPIEGIDVSHHQGAIDWKKVAAAGVQFAFLKASEGRTLRDARFAANWRGAKDAGIARGAYHYFHFCTPGADQAENFLAVAPRDADALSPVVDVEFVGNCRTWKSLDAVREELALFLERIEKTWPLAPILYLTDDSHRRIIAGHFDGRPVWIRSVFTRPEPDAYGGWLIWQYADTGRVPGIAGPVDRNVLRPGATLDDLRIARR
jgi:lysozyme